MATPADEAWKVMICARDVKQAQEALSHLMHMAGAPMGLGYDAQLNRLRAMTGYDLAEAIKGRVDDRMASIEAGLAKKD